VTEPHVTEPHVTEPLVTLELYSTSFCGACRRTRAVLDRVGDLVPAAAVVEHDVAREPDLAEHHDIRATPTVIVRDAAGAEVLRAAGVPSIDHVLVAAARALG
jgi:thiol-disulfide isomerase/thioredoxin